jgi:hypothetical protein
MVFRFTDSLIGRSEKSMMKSGIFDDKLDDWLPSSIRLRIVTGRRATSAFLAPPRCSN